MALHPPPPGRIIRGSVSERNVALQKSLIFLQVLGLNPGPADSANVLFQDQRSSLASAPPASASSHQQNILSHLPLHSQQQARSLLPLLPVGCHQMLHSPPCPGAEVGPSAAPSPDSSEGQRCSSREGSVQGEDLRSQNLDLKDSGQEENVQTCLKAIASLKITAEEPH